MSGTDGHESDGESELALSSKAEKIVDKKVTRRQLNGIGDHTKSMKMRARVNPPTPTSLWFSCCRGVVPKQQSIISKEFDVIVVAAFSFIYIILISYKAS